MAKDMTLLWAPGSPPCWRIMIALEEKNLKGYNQRILSVEKNEHKSKEVLDINPRGQVPTFKHGDKILNESLAACFYLESQFKSQGNKLIPDGAAEQALMYQRLFECFTLNQKLADLFYYIMRVPEEEKHDSTLKRHKEALIAELKLWEGYLDKAPCCMAGKTFTLADVAIFPSVAFLFRYGLCEERYPKLAAYSNGLKDRPSIKASWPPTWLDSPRENMLKDI
ncbi:glutathione S-transferase A-like isoform X1 [Chaetodon auriga]|uniref:glutathione S-transferase A-like isoform X1 n=1 Tax=Chaetodon auriga TaxID=39042 RepID=UPI004032A4D1